MIDIKKYTCRKSVISTEYGSEKAYQDDVELTQPIILSQKRDYNFLFYINNLITSIPIGRRVDLF